MLSYTDNQNANLHHWENFKTLCMMDRPNVQALATLSFRRAKTLLSLNYENLASLKLWYRNLQMIKQGKIPWNSLMHITQVDGMVIPSLQWCRMLCHMQLQMLTNKSTTDSSKSTQFHTSNKSNWTSQTPTNHSTCYWVNCGPVSRCSCYMWCTFLYVLQCLFHIIFYFISFLFLLLL